MKLSKYYFITILIIIISATDSALAQHWIGPNNPTSNISRIGDVSIGEAVVPGVKLNVNGSFRVNSPNFPGRDYRIVSGAAQQIFANNDLYLYVDGGHVIRVANTNSLPNRHLDVRGYNNQHLFRISGDGTGVGIGNTNPNKPLTIKGRGKNDELVQFRNTKNQNKWHLNFFYGGLNFAESGKSDYRLLLKDGGNVCIGTPTSFPYKSTRLSVEGSIGAKGAVDIVNQVNTGWASQLRFIQGTTVRHAIVDDFSTGRLTIHPGFDGKTSNWMQINGNVLMYGSGFAIGGSWFSDERLKTNVKPIQSGLNVIKQLEGVSYEWDIEAANELKADFPKGRQIGLIAQEVEKIVPELVKTTPDGYKAVEYQNLTAVLIEAVKEQDEIIEQQQTQLNKLENRLSEIEEMLNDGRGGKSAAKRGLETTVSANLLQNTPNPFSYATTIAYQLPMDFGQASIEVFDFTGRQVEHFDLNNTTGSVELNATNLSNGTYLYTLTIDGQSISSKKLIVQK